MLMYYFASLRVVKRLYNYRSIGVIYLTGNITIFSLAPTNICFSSSFTAVFAVYFVYVFAHYVAFRHH